MYNTVENPALRVIGAPREYVQGPGAIDELAYLAARHGKGHVLAIIDAFLFDTLSARLKAQFGARNQKITCLRFAGEATHAEGERIVEAMKGADVVAGIGGGKCIDIGKFVALHGSTPVFSVPTIASNDAPTSRLIVLYSEDHAITGTEFLAYNPDLVLVDTDVIAAAPQRLLKAGIGDALTKLYEARATAKSNGTNSFTAQAPYLGRKLGAICHEVIRRCATPVLDAMSRDERHPDFEELVETLVYISGIAFESGGLSVAHSMVRGLTRVPALGGYLHGEQVAYSTLVQIVLESDVAELHDAVAFNRAIGLPVSLSDMGVADDALNDAAQQIATGTMTAPYITNFPHKLDAQHIIDAILQLETFARTPE
ncbi:glycerol dehydrogenase [Sulfitobacter geojensis]|uniref:Glycerol dehydrogenase n=3 Tax=Sulfitobacter geojensis TaxID=1342299 RepID=A0AAE2W371_9RHOB|nr:glycerol dehydrogenase [Sulfitobacter geojensis]MBM1695569.1 glycerol dehydrogenase [Sulfitobacter geojensis]MBM1707761.1 glycerol dehydrogenase [Sulfitobacter geojensis]MBM1711833.1 glycerol dehydrogenase [Sulfitobacter geojensis]MBM1715892.1 glycerol dehydrogenase [Sulfitobacter geojensis]MBM1719966.1 glycerol dehydrogenase [Sulfitobacter geojensis]